MSLWMVEKLSSLDKRIGVQREAKKLLLATVSVSVCD